MRPLNFLLLAFVQDVNSLCLDRSRLKRPETPQSVEVSYEYIRMLTPELVEFMILVMSCPYKERYASAALRGSESIDDIKKLEAIVREKVFDSLVIVGAIGAVVGFGDRTLFAEYLWETRQQVDAWRNKSIGQFVGNYGYLKEFRSSSKDASPKSFSSGKFVHAVVPIEFDGIYYGWISYIFCTN
jgi:hypothetical protein